MEAVGFPIDEHVKSAVVDALNMALSSVSYQNFFSEIGELHARSYFCVTHLQSWLPQLFDIKSA